MEAKSGPAGAIAYVSVLLSATMDSVVDHDIISHDEIARVLGHKDEESAITSVKSAIDGLSPEEALLAMEVLDKMEKLSDG